ncbi:MAG TPA: hypothetical protein VFW08_12435 [bacterium]|nr:hypothetical protein [bacterium]
MSGSMQLMDLVARSVQEERIADARRERLLADAPQARGGVAHIFNAIQGFVAAAGQLVGGRRSAASPR